MDAFLKQAAELANEIRSGEGVEELGLDQLSNQERLAAINDLSQIISALASAGLHEPRRSSLPSLSSATSPWVSRARPARTPSPVALPEPGQKEIKLLAYQSRSCSLPNIFNVATAALEEQRQKQEPRRRRSPPVPSAKDGHRQVGADFLMF